VGNIRRTGIAAAALAAPLGLAYRFALAYRVRAGYPRRNPPQLTPADLGLPFEPLVVESGGIALPAWFIPTRDGAAGPGVVLVHGWESARDRTLPLALFLNAAGFHTLTFDVRGHGANPPEPLPLTAGEFGADALAAFRMLLDRPDVTDVAIAGHSMGAIGAILAAAADPRVAAVVATSAPADPYRLTRLTFRLAHLPIPDVIAYPLAWLTTRVYVRPRGHRVADISAAKAIAQYAGPVLLAHGELDTVVPLSHMGRLAAAARAARVDDPRSAPVETLVVAEGHHSWLYEDAAYRGVVAGFLTRALGGPLDPADATERAKATNAERIPDIESSFAAIEAAGGLRTLASVALPGATRPPRVEPESRGGTPASGTIPAAPRVEP
jgi:pimeloyl-ACP methyl ester carboxylesterase